MSPVYSASFVIEGGPPVIKDEALNAWYVSAFAFINQGTVLGKFCVSPSNSVEPVLKLPNVSVLNPGEVPTLKTSPLSSVWK